MPPAIHFQPSAAVFFRLFLLDAEARDRQSHGDNEPLLAVTLNGHARAQGFSRLGRNLDT